MNEKEQICAAIAKACELFDLYLKPQIQGDDLLYCFSKTPRTGFYRWMGSDIFHGPVPNYTESLDAMAEAENVLHGLGKWQDYLKSLWKTVNQPPYSCDTITHTENFLAWNFIHATAAQRAAAFLAVVEGRGE